MPNEPMNPEALPVVLGPEHAGAAPFCSQDAGRWSLTSLCVDPVKRRVEATDGHVLVLIPLKDTPAAAYVPAPEGFPPAPVKPVLLSPRMLAAALADLPKGRAMAVVGVDEKSVHLGSGDGVFQRRECAHIPGGEWPDTDGVMPREKGLRIKLEARDVKTLVDYAVAHGGADAGTVIEFGWHKAGQAIDFAFALPDGRKVTGLIMPVVEE